MFHVEHLEIMRATDYMLSKEEFELVYDSTYDMYKTEPVPPDIDRYYQSEDYISHTDSKRGLKEIVYQWVKQFQLGQKRRRLYRFTFKTARVLDVGTGTGEWPAFLGACGHEVEGIETNEVARSKAEKKGVSVVGHWDELQNKTFDVITLWHVLEHLPDPSEAFDALFRHLAPGGHLFIAVPNFRSLDAKEYGKYWAAYDVPRHLWHFSSKSIQKLGEEKGFFLIKKWPMWFDVFYVALLSESYKPRSSFFRAVWVSLRSTLSALRTTEHSSMLYVLKKPE
jgi:2-polyprenyl-3-methyl-5-hydroxy-6-metoxy-1,4-benzoquinol methylase